VFDFDDPMGDSTCVACGECVQACPTGALMPAREAGLEVVDKRWTRSAPSAASAASSLSRAEKHQRHQVRHRPRRPGEPWAPLQWKGRYGFDYAHHPQRLTKPLIRSQGSENPPFPPSNPANWKEAFREATWEEALGFRCNGLKRIRDGDRFALADSARRKAPTRRPISSRSWCAPASAPTTSTTARACATPRRSRALLEAWAQGAVSNQVSDVMNAEVVLIIGANPRRSITRWRRPG